MVPLQSTKDNNMHVVSGWGRMFPYVSVLSFFTTYLRSTWLWFTFFLTTALYLLYDYLPNLAIDFLSNWDEALLLRDVTVIHQLFPWVIGFYVFTTICGALAGLCDRYLTTSMANQFSKKSLSLAMSPRYLHLWLGDAKYSKAKTPLAGTIVRDPERYFNNMPKLIASFVAALVFTVIAVFRLLDFGLHGSLAYACFFGAGAMMSVFYITRSWNEQYLNKLNASQRATDTLHELRFSQNVFSQPNTLPLYRKRITGSLDKIQSSQRAIAWLRFFSDLFSGVLDSCMQPLFMVVVFYSIYYTQAGTVTYSTLRMLARLMVSIYSALVAIIKNRESLAEMQTSLVNMRGLESEFKPLPTHKLGLRTDHPGLYARGEYAMDKQSIRACFSVYKDLDNYPRFSYDHDKKMILSRGSRYALIGANGSGKSTFLRVLSGYIPMENPSQKIPHVVYYANDGHSLAHIMGTCPVIWGLVLYYWPLKHDVDDLSSLKPTYIDQKKIALCGRGYLFDA